MSLAGDGVSGRGKAGGGWVSSARDRVSGRGEVGGWVSGEGARVLRSSMSIGMRVLNWGDHRWGRGQERKWAGSVKSRKDRASGASSDEIRGSEASLIRAEG